MRVTPSGSCRCYDCDRGFRPGEPAELYVYFFSQLHVVFVLPYVLEECILHALLNEVLTYFLIPEL